MYLIIRLHKQAVSAASALLAVKGGTLLEWTAHGRLSRLICGALSATP